MTWFIISCSNLNLLTEAREAVDLMADLHVSQLSSKFSPQVKSQARTFLLSAQLLIPTPLPAGIPWEPRGYSSQGQGRLSADIHYPSSPANPISCLALQQTLDCGLSLSAPIPSRLSSYFWNTLHSSLLCTSSPSLLAHSHSRVSALNT